MDLGLTGKGAVVLASTAGLGFAVARALALEGARVALSGRDAGRLAAALDELAELARAPASAGSERARSAASGGATGRARVEARGERVFGEVVDVADGRALERHLASARERFGAVDVLVLNAGGPPPSAAATAREEDLDRAYATTFKSAVRAVQTVLPWMRERRFGRIVAMTSMSVRQPIPELVHSNAMRAALTGFLKTLADEVASEGVLVNTVCTGLFATERLRELFAARAQKSGRSVAEEEALAVRSIPIGRFGDPAEFGAFVAFLVSERASFLTGAALPLDGGASRSLL